MNIAEAGHIWSWADDGPRGNRGIDAELLNEIENLILVCRICHSEIDKHTDRFPAELLIATKEAHEQRITLASGLLDDRRTHVLIYSANVGDHRLLPSEREAREALLPHRFPANERCIRIGTVDGSIQDRDSAFWTVEVAKLEADFRERVSPGVARGEIEHLSVFGLAPQPLLVRLGTLLTQFTDISTFQLHREPRGWCWPKEASPLSFKVVPPLATASDPVLVIAITAAISDERVSAAVGEGAAPWRITVDDPRHDAVRSRGDLSSFRTVALDVLNRIADAHGHRTPVHVLMVAPNSISVELGRVRLEKAANPWRLYDQPSTADGFIHALDIDRENNSG